MIQTRNEKRLPRSIVTRTNRVKWQPKCGPRGKRCRMGMDQGNSWTTKTRIWGIQGRQYGGPGDSGDNVVDQEDVRRTDPRRMRGSSYPTLEAQTSRKDKSNTPLRPQCWDYRSPAVARKVASPHQEPKYWHLSCNTVYVTAVRPTGSCSQDI